MRINPWLAVVAATLSLAAAASPRPAIDISVTDRVSGETLPVYWHRGERWIAGTPGNRYSITLHNRGAGRALAVLSVDGLNAVTGQTAAWDQNGYVLAPHQRAEIRGWRKSQERIAAFEFTALPDSYAARTGRPDHVGVIGVAVFREAPRVQSQVPWGAGSDTAREATGSAKAAEAGEAAGGSAPAPAAAQRLEADSARAGRLGTGHGRSETSYVELTQFERAQARPDQMLMIRYDSRARLIAMGVIAPPSPPGPNPFPGALGFVPDPPRR